MSLISIVKQFGANPQISASGKGGINIPTTDANTLIHNILNLIYFVGGAVAVVVIIIAGFRYVTSAGDSGAVGKAKNQILYGIIGLVVVMLAFTITQFVIGSF